MRERLINILLEDIRMEEFVVPEVGRCRRRRRIARRQALAEQPEEEKIEIETQIDI